MPVESGVFMKLINAKFFNDVVGGYVPYTEYLVQSIFSCGIAGSLVGAFAAGPNGLIPGFILGGSLGGMLAVADYQTRTYGMAYHHSEPYFPQGSIIYTEPYYPYPIFY